MKEAITAVYGAAVSLLVVVLYEYFAKSLGWSHLSAILGAVALGAILLLGYEVFMRSRFVRRRLSPIYPLEGTWRITLTNHERPSSVCTICYTGRRYAYDGLGINADGTLGSKWNSRDVHYDEHQEEFSFTSDADLIPSNKRVRNYGYIKFSRNASGQFDSGIGYFVDMAETLSQSHMVLERIAASEYAAIEKSAKDRTTARVKAA